MLEAEEWKEVSCGPGEQLEDEDVQCRDGDLDYVEKEKEEVEEREPGEVEAEELDDEDNPNQGESSDVSCLDSDSEETNQYSSTRENFSESGVRKEGVPKVRHRKVRRRG